MEMHVCFVEWKCLVLFPWMDKRVVPFHTKIDLWSKLLPCITNFITSIVSKLAFCFHIIRFHSKIFLSRNKINLYVIEEFNNSKNALSIEIEVKSTSKTIRITMSRFSRTRAIFRLKYCGIGKSTLYLLRFFSKISEVFWKVC